MTFRILSSTVPHRHNSSSPKYNTENYIHKELQRRPQTLAYFWQVRNSGKRRSFWLWENEEWSQFLLFIQPYHINAKESWLQLITGIWKNNRREHTHAACNYCGINSSTCSLNQIRKSPDNFMTKKIRLINFHASRHSEGTRKEFICTFLSSQLFRHIFVVIFTFLWGRRNWPLALALHQAW